jgi:hypothetical protein
MTITEALNFLVANGPGRTASELAHAIFADGGYQQRVNQDLNALCDSGKIHRDDEGGTFRYYPGLTEKA